jgi:predicted nucleotidyltransferase component of viral defense system
MPYLRDEECLALKGGTAINFFIRDLPRLSVDIDLAYVGFEKREVAFKNIDGALLRILDKLNKISIESTIL